MMTMKKIMTLLLVAALALSMTVALAESAPASVTASGEAPLREAADGMSGIIIIIPDGAPLTILSTEGDWYLVTAGGQTGYMHRSNVAGFTPDEQFGETPAPAMSVTIFTSRRTVMTPGETVVLTSLLEGFEGYNVSYQWECDMGGGFVAVPGATGDSYSFAASIESLAWSWRLAVTAW